MAEGLVHSELLAACSSLGYDDGVKYHREADCLETTKDLLRYLRKDDESHEVRRALGETRVLQTDLLPLLRDHSSDAELLQLNVRLLVNLTNPTLLLFREELPEEKVTRRHFMQLVAQQQAYKEAFTDEKVWQILVGKLGELLQVPWEEREEEDRMLLERILILTRNVLSVQANPEDEQRTDDDASIHDQVLWALHLAGLEDLLLYLATSHSEQDLSFHVLEIISLMLREQDAAQLARAGLHRSQQEKDEDGKELRELRRKEALKREQERRRLGTRHSRFGGTYVVQSVKSISDRDLILHRPLAHLGELNFDRDKRPKRHNKNRVPLMESSNTRRSTLAVRLFLQEFCIEFLTGAYNSLMNAVRDSLERARAQEHDEMYYLWAARFFMEFNRHHQFKVELVSETLTIQMFHYIQTQIDNYYEMMTTDKKKIPLWSRRMHKALRAYQELLMTLARMDASPSEAVRESSTVLKSSLFYVVEYREMVLLLLQNYDPLKMTPAYLKDAVEATHIFLKLLEAFCGRSRHVLVQRKAKKQVRKKSRAEESSSTQPTEEQLQDQWDQLSSELSAVVQGEAGDLPDVVPFDALSEDSEEQQKAIAMRRVNGHLRAGELKEGVALLRAAREVWPEGDVFGSEAIDHTEEFLALQEIFMANLNPPQNTPVDEEEEEEDEEEQEEERMVHLSEQEFSFQEFVRRFANTKVVRAYCRLLQTYPTNTHHTNHCILKLFHRIAWDCKLPAIFFQASLFRVFQQALDDPLRASNESAREIAKFGKYILRQFFKVTETNKKVFVELLFWKTNREALEIECGYSLVESGKQAAKQAWLEEEEEELRRLFEEMDAMPEEECGGKDTVDLILDSLINRSRTRRSVIKKLRELGLMIGVPKPRRRTSQLPIPRQWSEEEEIQLRELFEENKEAMDVVGRIMDNLTVRRPKHRVVDKIMELGLVQDRKQLRKKRAKKTKAGVSKKHQGEDFLAANQPSDSDDDRDSSEEGSESEDDERETAGDKSVSRRPPRQPVPTVTPALISKAMGVVLEAGRSEAVEWLSRVLVDVADDREEDGDFEPIPILAMTEACTDAMEDEEFLKLLRLVGLQPPLTHQEMFWRVPSRLSVAGLRKRAQYLSQGVSGGLQEVENPDEPLEPVEETQEMEVDSQQKPKKKLRRPETSKAKNHLASASVTDEDKENHCSDLQSSRLTGGASDEDSSVSLVPRLLHPEDSSDDEAPLSSLKVVSAESSPIQVGRPNKRGLPDSDSDSNSRPTTPSMQGGEGRKEKKKRLVVDSDDEEEVVLAQSSRRQRVRPIIDSDDE